MGNNRGRLARAFEDRGFSNIKHYSKARAATILSVISVITCILTVIGFLWVRATFSDVDAIRLWVEENHLLGAMLMLFICMLQVVVAFIPGELVEIAAGYAFGGWLGALICTVGIALGSIISILLARKFGRRLVESLYPREKIDALPILNDRKKRNTMVFLLFLIPGTPKDFFTYVVGMTGMSIPLYLALTVFARFPSIIISTLGGGALGDNMLWKAVAIFLIAAIISTLGYFIYLVISNKYQKKESKKEQ